MRSVESGPDLDLGSRNGYGSGTTKNRSKSDLLPSLGVGPVEEMSVTNKGEQWHGPMENLSFSIGHGISLSVKQKKSVRRVQVGNGKKCKSGVSKILGEERKDDGGLDPGMDGDDVDMEAIDDSEKHLKVIDVVDKEDALLTVAEVGIDQPRKGQ